MSKSTLRVVGQIYPWDLVNHPARASEWQSGGVDEVAIASSYHAVRAVSWKPGDRPAVIQQTYSAHYLPIEDHWKERTLRPRPPQGLPDDLFVGSARIAADQGLDVRAWVVLTHVDHHPAQRVHDFATLDLWGNRSVYSLCPSRPEVRRYARGLIDDVVRKTGVTKFLVESLSAVGFRHLVAHDKSSFSALSAEQVDLLSLCFCESCTKVAAEEGLDLQRHAKKLRSAFGSPQPEDQEAIADIHRVRTNVNRQFLAELTEPSHGRPLSFTLAATAQSQTYGPFSFLHSRPDKLEGLCAELSAPASRGWSDVQEFSRWQSQVAGTVNLQSPRVTAAQVLEATGPKSAEGLALLNELYLYHLGTQKTDDFACLDLHQLKARHEQNRSTDALPERQCH